MADKTWKMGEGNVAVCNTTVKDKNQDAPVPLTFSFPATGITKDGDPEITFDALVEYLRGTTRVGEGDSAKDVPNWQTFYQRALYATDLKERAAVRENVAAESTVIRVNGVDVDLLLKSPKEIVASVNAARGLKALTGKDAGKAFEVVARKITQGYEKDGQKVAPIARENEQGMLVLIDKGGNGQNKK